MSRNPQPCDPETYIVKAILLILGLLLASWVLMGSDARGDEVSKSKPTWATTLHPPTQSGAKCYIGSSSSAQTKEQALNDAYKNGLINVVRGEFPELTKISERSLENLYGAEYARNMTLRSDLVRFSGLLEHHQSPYVEEKKSGKHDAYRILCWPLIAIEAERKRLANIKLHPESAKEAEEPEWQPDWGNASAMVEFDSDPQRATVEIDGAPVCVTPCKQFVSAGNRSVAMKLAQYKPLIEEMNIRNAMIIKRKLEPNFATIDIISIPPGLKVRLDSGSYGNPYLGGTDLGTTPIKGLRVDAGRHELFVTGDKYGENLYRFFVKAQEHRVISIEPTGRQGAIMVDAHDENMNRVVADVYIDGVLVGKTPFRAKVLIGGHTIELVTKYSQTWKGEIDVLDGSIEVIDRMVKESAKKGD